MGGLCNKPAPNNAGTWVVYKNIDMCGQGDEEIIHNWRAKTSIAALRRKVERKGYSAISVGSSFGHAALKSFDYQLTKGHMRPSQGYTNEIHVYFPEDNVYETPQEAAAAAGGEAKANTAGKSLFVLRGTDFTGRDDIASREPCRGLKEERSRHDRLSKT